MKFANIYREAQEKVRSMLLTFWTPGAHVMRPYFKNLLNREPLMAEPVFQSIFPWREDTTGVWKGTLCDDFVSKRGIGTTFKPRANQSESWAQAHKGNSIVVTSGTGSGKTECFMFPVLDSIYKHRDEGGIQAIFLYPLNALTEDQRDRLDYLCRMLDLTYAVYNGSTKEDNAPEGGSNVELRTREDIRTRRPHVLLTNPSMLEYILVRDKDQAMINNSRGKLRWIVIDEAHTFSGSSALELKWQIKRTLDAFGVTADQVQFACTSATIGDASAVKKLQDFIAEITGQSPNRIKIITGERVVPQLTEGAIANALKAAGLNLDVKRVVELRDAINSNDGMSLSEIMRMLKQSLNVNEALELLDSLCDIKIGDKALLALRGHFNMRTINGIYACGNPNCGEKNHARFGHITTRFTPTCSCGANMLELYQCARCKNVMLSGCENFQTHEIKRYSGYGDEDGYFTLSDETLCGDKEIIDEDTHNNGLIYLSAEDIAYTPPTTQGGEMGINLNITPSGSTINGLQAPSPNQWITCIRDNKHYCAKCDQSLNTRRGGAHRFKVSVEMLNSTLAPVFLNECSSNGNDWGKYLAFTDSRQGTARSAKGFNIEVERNITRKQAYEAARDLKINPRISPAIQNLIDMIKANPAMSEADKQNNIDIILANAKIKNVLTLGELSTCIFNQQLYSHICDHNDATYQDLYAKALLRQFLRGRSNRGQNAESLGLITIVYDGLENEHVPAELEGKCNDKDWQNFLKIVLDYLMRGNNHVQPLEHGEKDFLRSYSTPSPICSPTDPKVNIDHWPCVDVTKPQQSKFVRLLCAALGIRTFDDLKAKAKTVNDILLTAFNHLESLGYLKKVSPAHVGYNVYGTDEYVGTYYLDVSKEATNIHVKVCDKAWTCPVSQTFVDTLFMGYSPVMGPGEITPAAMDIYKIADPQATYDNTTLSKAALGDFWSNLHDNIVDNHTCAYLAAEHSGQQDRELLKQYTEEFKAAPPRLNVLQCSTTMEMGVDIGDIDFVLLTTVPPAAANYMQRVGRAGRSGQTRAAAFSFCNDTPTATAAFNNPMWAIKSVSGMSKVVHSATILQRHINSFFFRAYLLQASGISLGTTIDDFITANIDNFITWLYAMQTDGAMQAKFVAVFGKNVQYTIGSTIAAIEKIRDDYKASHAELINAMGVHRGKTRRQAAINHQLEKLEDESLLQYLSISRFLPNASMPTGVVDFKINDQDHQNSLNALIREKKALRDRIRATGDPTRRQVLGGQLNAKNAEINRRLRSEIISRDGRLSLNEYAPGQMVVVDERNYPSAGIMMRGEYGTGTREKFLYFCRHCGHIEYLDIMDEHRSCPVCNYNYCGILDNRAQSLTRAYEPAGFCADANRNASRTEHNPRQFYDIRPVLLNYNSLQPAVYMTEISAPNATDSEIMFCNAGTGKGFAICTKCGRAAIENEIGGDLPASLQGHKRVDCRDKCDAGNQDVKRNVVLTSRLQTCYVVIALKNSDNNSYVDDEHTALSLGVIITRAAARVLGIDGGEIGFGVREERNRWLIFIYDTAKGGCGYSLYLNDKTVMQQVLDEALHMLRHESNCSCEHTEGACPECLSSRDTFMFDSKLSKRKALEWLMAQARAQAKVPAEVLNFSKSANVCLDSINDVLTKAVNDDETTQITLVMSDLPDEPHFSKALDASTSLGSTILKARQLNKSITLLIEYHPELYKDNISQLPLQNLDNLIPGGKVLLVKDLGDIKPLAQITTGAGIRRYLTTDADDLIISDEWGNPQNDVYYDDTPISYTIAQLKEFDNSPDEIILQGKTDKDRSDTHCYFSAVIAQAVGLTTKLDETIKNAVSGCKATVEISDPYLISPLAMIMAVDLVAELKTRYGFDIIDLIVSNNCKNSAYNNNYGINDFSEIRFNFSDQYDADNYLIDLCDDRLGVEPAFSEDNTAHFRFLKIGCSNGSVLEIRLDHGFAGGWTSRQTVRDVKYGRPAIFNRANSSTDDILYYLVFTK